MSDNFLDRGYRCFGSAEYFCIVGTGAFAFRFGPYTGPETGKIISRCVAEQIPLTIVANCGPEFDWDLACDMRGDLTKMNFVKRWLWKHRERRLKKIVADFTARSDAS